METTLVKFRNIYPPPVENLLNNYPVKIELPFLFILQLEMSDEEITRLALLFNPNTLETVALLYFGTSEAEIGQTRMDCIGHAKAFNRELIHIFLNKGHNRKVIISFDSLPWLPKHVKILQCTDRPNLYSKSNQIIAKG